MIEAILLDLERRLDRSSLLLDPLDLVRAHIVARRSDPRLRCKLRTAFPPA
jgi:hypothetical protein